MPKKDAPQRSEDQDASADASRPYEPKYKGFDEAAQKRAQATVDRAKESEGARGEDANKEYVDDGPKEYKRRKGED